MEDIKRLQACGFYVFVKKDEMISEIGGMELPDAAKKKPNTGEIISVGSSIEDKNIAPGKKAIFNTAAGSVIEIFDITLSVIPEAQILGVY